jgi:hypothetical protein
MLLFVLIKGKIFSLSACLIRNQQDVLSIFLAGKRGEMKDQEKASSASISAHLYLRSLRMQQGVSLRTSKGSSGNSGKIWGEGMFKIN